MQEFEPDVYTTECSVVVTDDQIVSPIRLFYDPATYRWRAYVLTPTGQFYREVFSINACACGVAEYCRRKYTSGNVYIDVCYCEEIDINSITSKFQPPSDVLMAYRTGRTRTYRRWQRDVVTKVADYIRERVKELWKSAEDALTYVFLPFEGVDVDYFGFFVTAYKLCPGYYYGIFCRMKRDKCSPVNCRDICELEHVDCDFERLKECEAQKKVILLS